ncbi:short chain dehydrogenase [Luteibacter rhizovicinus DSM 16549]|uniref:Short chain dehydrogenase n=1 Tax=Luteibacter rhizovicinus DSM 16549 TaxID=1440763 RepID=A0A0G9H9C1_9GAMM|nr:SDR family oxidoreductase [Luteibacter rhizovicinus]APG06427.1 short chain dehydrogenase [Luteibacter rhizovicinus DSM 16549]KLD66410.1 short-chain dehydrogenase [Luteibacter rhizovicinus DSM 16549]KLD80068.1 short-chain dehydrogenase [Xanthomonas hyacinthi DSM 19077]
MFSFTNQDVLVVGGSSGIGLATAKAFAAAGARVTIASRSGEKLAAALKEIGDGSRSQVLDTGDALAVESFLAAHTWNHVVVSAAKTPSGPVRQLSLEDAHTAMESKFWGAYRVARAARIRDGGSLTIVSGFLSVRPSATSVLQGAINAALESLVRGMALEFSPVRVNAVSPGMIRTPLWSGMDDDKREAMFAAVAEKLPAKRAGEPEDIANAVLYAAATPFTTGSTIVVDGGGSIA